MPLNDYGEAYCIFKKNIIIIIIFFEVKSSFAWLGNS